MSLRNISDAVVAGNDQWDTDQARLRSLSQMWGSSTAPMARGMRSAMAAVADLGPVRAEPENRAAYPDSDLGGRWPPSPAPSAATSASPW